MYRRPSKRMQLIQRVATYVTMVFAVVAIVGVILLVILGYRLDSENGLEQGALLQFNTQPTGAVVKIDDITIGGRTPNKSSVLAGTHTVTMLRDGYLPWTKNVNLNAGTLTWLDYGILVPQELPVTSIASFASLNGALMPSNRESVILLPDASIPSLHIYDLRSQTPPVEVVALPADIYSDGTTADASHTFTLSEATADGRYVLVKHHYKSEANGEHDEWIVFDTDNAANSKNATRLLEVGLSHVHFSGNSGTSLYGLNEGTIRKLDLSAQTISRPLVSNVKDFTMVESNVATFTANDPANPSIELTGVYQDGDDESAVLQSVPAGTKTYVAASRYFNTTYMTVANGKQVSVLRGDLPHTTEAAAKLGLATRFMTQGDILSLSFSPDGQYVFAQTNKGFVSYDIEHDRQYAVATAAEDGNEMMQWIDQATVANAVNGQLTIREFDGANRHALTPIDHRYPVTLSPNGRYLYSIGTTTESSSSVQLQRITLILQ